MCMCKLLDKQCNCCGNSCLFSYCLALLAPQGYGRHRDRICSTYSITTAGTYCYYTIHGFGVRDASVVWWRALKGMLTNHRTCLLPIHVTLAILYYLVLLSCVILAITYHLVPLPGPDHAIRNTYMKTTRPCKHNTAADAGSQHQLQYYLHVDILNERL